MRFLSLLFRQQQRQQQQQQLPQSQQTMETLEQIFREHDVNDDDSIVSVYIDEDDDDTNDDNEKQVAVTQNDGGGDDDDAITALIETSPSFIAMSDEIFHAYHTLLETGKISGDTNENVRLCVNFFQSAQHQRVLHGTSRPLGIIGLFNNIADIRSDMVWAQDAAYRRQHNKPYISWEDYYKKEQNGLVRPYFTYVFLLSNIILMVLAFYLNEWTIEPMDVNPMLGPTADVLIRLGALDTHRLIVDNEWWRLVTPIFLHAGILHIVFNAFCIMILSRNIERSHGTIVTATIFLLSAASSNLISAILQPGSILVGASGGLFALYGVCLADIIMNWKILFLVLKSRQAGSGCCLQFCCLFGLLIELAINTIPGFTPWVDNFAHLGGLFYGFCLSFLLLKTLPVSFSGNDPGTCHRICRLTVQFLLSGAGIALTAVIVSLLILGRSDGTTTPCPSCRYISCAPFPFWTEDKWFYCDGCDSIVEYRYKKSMK